MSLTMFVDPGLGGTGAAVFKDIQEGVIQPPIWHDRIVVPKEVGEWVSRSVHVAMWIQNVVKTMRGKGLAKWNSLVVEFPEVWSGSLTSNTAVRGTKGDSAPLLKLASLSGMIAFSFLMGMRTVSSPQVHVRYIRPAEWKGQLPKKCVIDRIRRAYCPMEETGAGMRDHEADAVGMGLAFQKGGRI